MSANQINNFNFIAQSSYFGRYTKLYDKAINKGSTDILFPIAVASLLCNKFWENDYFVKIMQQSSEESQGASILIGSRLKLHATLQYENQ